MFSRSARPRGPALHTRQGTTVAELRAEPRASSACRIIALRLTRGAQTARVLLREAAAFGTLTRQARALCARELVRFFRDPAPSLRAAGQLWADAWSESGWRARRPSQLQPSRSLWWSRPSWCAPRATRRFAVSCRLRPVLRKGVFLARRYAGRAAKSLTLQGALFRGKADDQVRCRSCATCPPRTQATFALR